MTLAKKNPFHGHVSSPNSGCEQARTDKVFKKRNGPDGLYGSTTTDNDGKWSIPATPTGNFYAKVIRRKEGAAGTIFVCKPDVSPPGTSAAGAAATRRAARPATAGPPQAVSN